MVYINTRGRRIAASTGIVFCFSGQNVALHIPAIRSVVSGNAIAVVAEAAGAGWCTPSSRPIRTPRLHRHLNSRGRKRILCQKLEVRVGYDSLRGFGFGWSEFFGDEGLFWFFNCLSKFKQRWRYNILRVFLMFFDVWMNILLLILDFYLNNLFLECSIEDAFVVVVTFKRLYLSTCR